jgi:hypothetical protein
LGSEPGFVQGPVQEVTGTISGKHTSSTISTMCPGGQPKNQQARRTVPKGGYRFTPVFPVEECAPFGSGDFAAVLDQPRAPLTIDNFPVICDKVLFITLRNLESVGCG